MWVLEYIIAEIKLIELKVVRRQGSGYDGCVQIEEGGVESKYGWQSNKEGKYVVYGGSVGEERQIDSFFNVERICECQNAEWEQYNVLK